MTFNETITHQLAHRSIRDFTNEPLSASTRETLLAVARQTASSQYLQSFSVISITDRALQAEIAKVSHQAYVAGPGELLIFVVDQYRASRVAALHTTAPTRLGSMDKFLQGAADATLAVQNTVNAAESLGLGAVILGSIQNDAERLYELLDLPELTFPILGLLVGHPAKIVQQKPRLPAALTQFTNRYALPAELAAEMHAYDPVVATYYAGRDFNQRADTFSALLTRSATKAPTDRRGELFQTLRRHGWFPEA